MKDFRLARQKVSHLLDNDSSTGQCVVKSKMNSTKTIYQLYTFYQIDASNYENVV